MFPPDAGAVVPPPDNALFVEDPLLPTARLAVPIPVKPSNALLSFVHTDCESVGPSSDASK
jgi:hypothetical protein